MEGYPPEEMRWIHHSSHLHALQLIPSDVTRPQTCCCQPSAATGRPDPVYGCRPCNFYVHKTCAELPAYLRHPSHPSHTLTLVPTPPYLQGTAQCDACWKQINGFSYHCTNCSFDLHAHCAFLPPTINQPSTDAAGLTPKPVRCMPPAIWPGQAGAPWPMYEQPEPTAAGGQPLNPVSSLTPAIWPGHAGAPWPMNGQPEPTAAGGQPSNPLNSLTPAVWPGQLGAPGHVSSGLDPIHSQGGGVLQGSGSESSNDYPSAADILEEIEEMRNMAAIQQMKNKATIENMKQFMEMLAISNAIAADSTRRLAENA